jgi:signal transduction histidine kinase
MDPDSMSGRVAAWATEIQNPVTVGLLTVFLFLLFPDCRLRTTAERRTALVAAVGIGLSIAGAVVAPTLVEFEGTSSPFALGVSEAASLALIVVGYTLFGGSIVASVALLVGRLRRAVGRERDQLRILAWAAAVATVAVLPAIFLPPNVPADVQRIVYLCAALGFLLIPASVGVAILRHGLLDIDLVIRRTVVVAVLAVFITVVYVAIVVGAGALVGSSGNVLLSALAAAVVALAFQPVRRRAQGLANRLVYGERATPYEVLHEFSERVAGSYAAQDVLPRMATILGEGTGAERAQVWLRVGSELRPTAAWPEGARRSRPYRTGASELPEISDVTLAVPVSDRGELLGALSVTMPPSDPLTGTEEKLVGDLAHQAGLVLQNVKLLEDLRASRARLVAAQDEERRRIERDIHDGAQQQLVALAVKVQLVDRAMQTDVAAASRLLAEMGEEAQDALDTLRDLARGIYPPLLADEGLLAALRAQARKSPLDVEIRADGVGRYPRDVEATAYFSCLEALQNASKYSGAGSVAVSLTDARGGLSFEIGDDGRGFDPTATPRGSGLQNIADRLDALGGDLRIVSAPGDGTRLIGWIPVEAPGAGAATDRPSG